MSSIGAQLLSKIIHTGQLGTVLEWGITADDFKVDQDRVIFEVMCTYRKAIENTGAVLGPEILKAKYPQLEVLAQDPGMTLDSLCSELRKARLKIEAKEIFANAIQVAETDAIGAIDDARNKLGLLQALGLSKKTDVSFTSALDDIHLDYNATKTGIKRSEVLWPWAIMNEKTGGFQPDDYVVLYGRPKSFKSWCLAALVAHTVDQGIPTLVYTKEMTPKNIVKRVAAITMGVNYEALRMGKLSRDKEEELEFLRGHYSDISKVKNFYVLSGQDVAYGGDTMEWLHAKIEKYKPRMVFVDGLYLMSDGSKRQTADWTRVTNISRSARQMQLATSIPLVATVQANRKAAQHSGAEFDEIAYADGIGQDATIAIRCIAEKTQPTVAMVLAGSREFKLHGFRIGGIPATDFAFREVLTEKDIEKAKEHDHGDRESEDGEAHGKPRKKKTREREGEGVDVQKHLQDQLNGIHRKT